MRIANPWSLDLLKSQELLWLEGLLLEFDHLQGWILDSTSHGCRWVLSLLLWLDGPRKRRGMPVHLHAYFAGEVHGQCRSFWISLPCRGLRCDRAQSLHVTDFALPAYLIDDELWITIRFEIFNTNLIGDLHLDQDIIVFYYIVGTHLS